MKEKEKRKISVGKNDTICSAKPSQAAMSLIELLPIAH